MKRAFLILAVAVLLGGCATHGRSHYGYREPVYRDGSYYYPPAAGYGDYYYAPPRTVVHHYDYGFGFAPAWGHGWAPYGGLWGSWGPRSYWGPRYGYGLGWSSWGSGVGLGLGWSSGYWPYYHYPRSWQAPRPRPPVRGSYWHSREPYRPGAQARTGPPRGVQSDGRQRERPPVRGERPREEERAQWRQRVGGAIRTDGGMRPPAAAGVPARSVGTDGNLRGRPDIERGARPSGEWRRGGMGAPRADGEGRRVRTDTPRVRAEPPRAPRQVPAE
ncbi:hypothetical protein ACFO3Q_16820, partial [Coralloluteibacterium thermophilus]